jgi:hypothetical protein
VITDPEQIELAEKIFGENYQSTINEITKHENERFKRILAQTIIHILITLFAMGIVTLSMPNLGLSFVLVMTAFVLYANALVAGTHGLEDSYNYKYKSKHQNIKEAEEKVLATIKDAAMENSMPEDLKNILIQKGIKISYNEAVKIIDITKQSTVQDRQDIEKYIKNDALKKKFKDSRLVQEISKRVVKDTLKIHHESSLIK